MANRNQGLQKQLVNLLNLAGHVRSSVLSQASGGDSGQGAPNPILAAILKEGYQQGFAPAMSDKDALSRAITVGRNGWGPGHTQVSTGYPGNASATIIQALLQARMKNGKLSPAEAMQSLHDDLKKENFTLRDTNLTAGETGLSQEQKDALTARRAAEAGIQLTPNAKTPSYKKGGLSVFADQISKKFDPVKFAREAELAQYMNRGAQDIQDFQNQAAIMSGLVPDSIQPLYQQYAQQRANQMLANLGQYQDQMQQQPVIQALRDKAKDMAAKAKANGALGGGSSAGSLSGYLAQYQASHGGSGGGQSGGSSKGALSGSASGHSAQYYNNLSRQLAEQLAYGRLMGQGFTQWEQPVIGAGQFKSITNYVPHTVASFKRAPAITDYFTAMSGG